MLIPSKKKRFRSADNPNLTENEAFLLSDETTRAEYRRSYEATRDLYIGGQPSFDEIMNKIQHYAHAL